MLCPSCGARNVPTAELCVSCGEALESSADEPEEDALLGRVLGGEYELEELIGEGSMGRVYAARQVELDKEVAVKVLHAHVAADPKVAKRFQREARTASLLSHPNSLQVFDFGRDGDVLYIVMELLDGPDLLELLEDEFPFSPRRIGHLVGGVLRALEEAHDLGVIHRDLKAENIMVVEDHQGREHVKVCDFGIAKLVETDGSAITVSGFVCGTPEYMAPEQARGEPLDARADLYAIGCLLYQLLTGTVPFKGGSALGTITKHLTEPVEPPSRRRPELHIPRSLERVALRALAKDRDRRFANAAEMRAALEAAVDALGPFADAPLGTHTHDPTAAATPSRPFRRLLVPGLLVVGGVLVGGLLALTRGGPSAVDDEPSRRVGASTDAGGRARADAGRARDAQARTPPPQDASSTQAARCGDGPACAAPLRCCPTCDGWTCAERCVEPQCGAPEMSPSKRRAGRRPSPPATHASGATEVSEGRAAFLEGRERFLRNDIRGAIERFEAAARAMPRDPRVQKELARAYMRVGEVRRGTAAYERYLRLAPEAPDRELIEQLIERARAQR